MFKTDIVCQCDCCHFSVMMRAKCTSSGEIIYKDVLDAMHEKRWKMVRGKTICPRCINKGVVE